jgi:DNA polymerase III epsilon subunit-like protein
VVAPREAEYSLSPEAAAVNGLTVEKLEVEGFDLAGVLSELRMMVAGHDVIVGQNIYQFDLPIMRRIDRQTTQWTYSVFHDTKLLWNAWTLGIKREENEDIAFFYGRVAQQECRALSSLSHIRQTLLGPDKIPAHRALCDCNVCAAVYEMMRARGIFSEVMGM